MSRSSSYREPVSLRELFVEARFCGAADVAARRCTSDSRTCRAGDVFVAVRGTQADGHDFADEAVARGAVAVVAERPLSLGVPVCVVPDTREALGRLCQALAGDPSRTLRAIGVTGTNGKTTTTRLIASVLDAAGYHAARLDTLEYFDGEQAAPAELTTPSAPVLADWLARAVDAGCSHAVVEVSSHAIDQRRIAGIELSAACLTNLRRDHLDYHETLRNYHAAKSRIFHQLRPDGIAVVNGDDPTSLEYAPLIPCGVLSVAVHRSANVTAEVLERTKSEQTFLLTAGEMTAVVRTTIIGDHHVENCLIAAAVGLAEGIDLATIVRGLENVRSVPGRLERIECGQPFGVYVDYAHTPDALAVALSTLRQVTAGRVICVFGAGGDRDSTKRAPMGRVVEQAADVAIITNDNPRHEDPRSIAAAVLQGFERPAMASYVPDREAAICAALKQATADDCVLIAGRGHEPLQSIGGQQIPLDDRDVARRFLYNLEPASPYASLMTVSNS
ncbi:MAG: UDP-N-acetylmuramoyl-L-alanyl-D-glutamate--2,6-diaminopimelate ligase [Planctomycetota bacterium]|nr:MAG: UDP-N-acetylmuramoyl-L-alanyl-D-glutamate--2,6-diaminopimelate ligase [Planctomycetota bacterium]